MAAPATQQGPRHAQPADALGSCRWDLGFYLWFLPAAKTRLALVLVVPTAHRASSLVPCISFQPEPYRPHVEKTKRLSRLEEQRSSAQQDRQTA